MCRANFAQGALIPRRNPQGQAPPPPGPAAAAAAGALAAGRAFGATLTAEQAAAWTVFSAAQEEHLTQKLKLQAVKLLQQHAEQAQSATNEKKVTMWLQAGLGVAGLTVVLLVGIKARREGP